MAHESVVNLEVKLMLYASRHRGVDSEINYEGQVKMNVFAENEVREHRRMKPFSDLVTSMEYPCLMVTQCHGKTK